MPCARAAATAAARARPRRHHRGACASRWRDSRHAPAPRLPWKGALLGTYRFDKYLKEKSAKALAGLTVLEPDASPGRRRPRGRARRRDRAPPPPAWRGPRQRARQRGDAGLPRRARPRDRARPAVSASACWTAKTAAKLGMGAYLGVAQGSQEPPQFIHLTYAPRRRARRKVAIIGKGITFDSGGLDLKSADGMLRHEGATWRAPPPSSASSRRCARLRLPIEVHGLIAATENMPSGTAQRPGDIVRALNGLTIEIGNTDAEGRLTLADALSLRGEGDRARRDGGHGHPHRGGGDRAGPAGDRALRHPGRPRRAPARGRRAAAGERMWRLPSTTTTRTGSRATSPISTTSRASEARAPSWPRSSCGSSPAGCRGRISTSRAPRSPSGTGPLGPKGGDLA